MRIRGGGGGGGGISGVTSDNQTPGGLVVAGNISVEGGDGVEEFHTYPGGGIEIGKANDNNYALLIDLSPGSSGTEVRMTLAGVGVVFAISAEGKLTIAQGIGIFGSSAPAAQPVLATGAGHTVDDIISLLQSYGVCKQS